MRSASAKLVALGLSLHLVACGSSTPMRDRVSSGKWGEVCTEMGPWRDAQASNAHPGDMPEYEVTSALAASAPVEVTVRALSAAEVEKQTGLLAGPLLRFAPFEPASFQTILEIVRVMPDDPFERDWMVIELTVKVSPTSVAAVDLHMEMEERSPAPREPDKPWAPRWTSTTPWTAWEVRPAKTTQEDDLAKAMGFLRTGGTSSPSLWSMFDLGVLVLSGSLIDPKTRGADPLLVSKTIEGRQPSAEERAAIQQVLSLTADPPCGAVKPGASCTDRILFRRASESFLNALRFDVSYVLGGDGGCRLSDLQWTPLPPARTVREQLDAVFGKGGRTLEDLARRESVFQNTSDEVLDMKPPSGPVEDCGATAACSLWGRCQSQGGQCVARTSECEATDRCRSIGMCVAGNGECAEPAGAAEGCARDCAWWGGCAKPGERCQAQTPAHCASSIACKRFGACQLDLGSCVAKTSADCQASEACRERGFCSFQDDKCQAATDADCASSELCRAAGACKASGGLCVTGAGK